MKPCLYGGHCWAAGDGSLRFPGVDLIGTVTDCVLFVDDVLCEDIMRIIGCAGDERPLGEEGDCSVSRLSAPGGAGKPYDNELWERCTRGGDNEDVVCQENLRPGPCEWSPFNEFERSGEGG